MLGSGIYQRDVENGLEIFKDIIKRNLKLLDEYCTKNNKLYAITEIGYEAIPDSKWWTSVLAQSIGDYKPCYVLLCRNARDNEAHYFAPFPGQISEQNFVKFYKNPKTLFINDISDLYN